MSVIVTLLLVASVAVNLWFLRRRSNPKKQSVRSTLIQGIKDVRELTTLRQNFQSVVMFKDSKALLGFAIPGTERKFILKYGGVITCGNDLENMQLTERFALNCVKITVPRSKLLDVYADMKSIQVYDQRAGIFTAIELSDQNREIANNLEEVRQEAIQSDILRRADENTRVLLMSLAASLGMEAEVVFDDLDVQVTSAAVTKIPAAEPAEVQIFVAEEPPVAEIEGLELMEPEVMEPEDAAIIASHCEGEKSKSENIPEL